MPSRYPLFDRSRLTLLPLSEREHDVTVECIQEPGPVKEIPPKLMAAAAAIRAARDRGAEIIFMMGAHLIRSGMQRYIIDLMERGYITALAGNGACAIHDFELALIGATTESVAKYISQGQFGLWRELEMINQAFRRGAAEGRGAGESLGRLISEEPAFVQRDVSLLAAAWRLGLPFTLHVGIGCDIIHELPGCDGAAIGLASYTDFLIFCRRLENLQHGFFANFGSAVIGPEVFLKALAMVRNTAGPGGGPRSFGTLVCDLHDLPQDIRRTADKSDPHYYFRPWKTILSRAVSDGGSSLYVKGRHDETIPALWTALTDLEQKIKPELQSRNDDG